MHHTAKPNNCGALTLFTALQARCKEVQAAIKRETGHEREVKAALEEVKSRVATAKHAHATVIVEAEVAEQALRDEIVSLQACLRSSGGGSPHVHQPQLTISTPRPGHTRCCQRAATGCAEGHSAVRGCSRKLAATASNSWGTQD